jgi:hypothetical protein
MVYDYKKDVANWVKRYGNTIYIGDPEMQPQIPKWLKGEKKDE